MKITIEIIPHGEHRIPDTVGDWQWGKENLLIHVSELGDWRYNAAVAVHELVEALLCRNDGVSQAAVDAFDTAYERERPPMGNPGWDKPEAGDAESSPYRDQHCFATAVERMLIAAFGLSWAEYEKSVEAL